MINLEFLFEQFVAAEGKFKLVPRYRIVNFFLQIAKLLLQDGEALRNCLMFFQIILIICDCSDLLPRTKTSRSNAQKLLFWNSSLSVKVELTGIVHQAHSFSLQSLRTSASANWVPIGYKTVDFVAPLTLKHPSLLLRLSENIQRK